LPPGTCIGGVTFPPFFDGLTSERNAGTITITRPNGTAQLTTLATSGTYSEQIGGGSGTTVEPLFLSAGLYGVAGVGGAEGQPPIGAFSQTLNIPPPLMWGNSGDITEVDRSAGLDVMWSGGDPEGTIQITGDVGFICNAKNSDGHFRIPAFVLLSCPPGVGYLTVGTAVTTAFTVSGVSSATLNAVVTISKLVTFR
jgi:hypothetical protein